jgi:two-component system chemotaxis sensor kinase CheA
LEFPKGLSQIEAEGAPGETPGEGEIEEEAEENERSFSFDISPELIACFVSESTEHLENADVHLLTIETNPEDQEALNAVFRGFHTIKGSAGMLGLKRISALAHESENLLGLARDGKVVLENEAIDAVFDAVDALRRMVEAGGNALRNREAMPSDEAVPHLIARIKAVVAGTPLSPEPSAVIGEGKRVGEALVDSGVATREGVEKALSRQANPPKERKVGEILREANLTSERRVSTALAEQKQEGGSRKLGDILVDLGEISEEDLEAALEKQRSDPSRPKLGELLVRTGVADPKDVAHALRGQKRGGNQQAVQIREAVKVDADRLDSLIDTIGELVIAESMVSQSVELRSTASPQLRSYITQLRKITRELQEMGTSLRMVPVKPTFQKMARLLRDLAKKSGKKVEFVMSGEDTELDKTIVDNIGDPLIHMIRNSVDHGIEESPRKRLEAGKDEVGHVHLRAYHKGGNIYIEVQDDGRGLDRAAILAKGIERGLIREGENVSDREIYNQIFQPGFSTAKRITDVSGRGVGMDVVKRSIEGLRGQVEIMSEPGMGTIFTIRLPLTLAIIDGMVIRVGNDRYIVPTLSVVQSIRPDAGNLSSVLNRGAMLSVQDRLIPLFRVARLFDIEGAVEDPLRGTVVVVEDNGKQTGLLVDELLGQQQIVIKPLGELLQGTTGLSGGAIMPDGKVGLILDVAGLVRLATSGEGLDRKPFKRPNGLLEQTNSEPALEHTGV